MKRWWNLFVRVNTAHGPIDARMVGVTVRAVTEQDALLLAITKYRAAERVDRTPGATHLFALPVPEEQS